ncbi:MAG: transposase [Verrucomicrobiaceae bacterium]|nr:transposase [Verrucomicrobiaceae bacterium]
MKADLKTKIIINSTTTPASVHDSQVFEELLDDKDQAVLADSAYHSAEHEAYLIASTRRSSDAQSHTRSPAERS